MLYWLSSLSPYVGSLNLFRYITFRGMGALLTAFGVVFLLGPAFIRYMRRLQKEGQPIRDDGPASHLITKRGTPTMGGALIIFAFLVTTLLWGDPTNPFIWPILFLALALGGLGGVDDFMKLKKRHSRGLSARTKFLAQCGIAGISAFWVMWCQPADVQSVLQIPFLKDYVVHLGWLFPLLAIFVIVGGSNAVNLTDGLDGLAVGPTIIAFGVFAVFSYITGHHDFSKYLQIPFIPGVGEVSVICSAIVGACLGFLWYNAPPAMIFMGDVGSLVLGGVLALVSICVKQELLLILVGGIFVVETLSVIVQVISFKSTGKRVFLMAPIHHHFEKKGWAEPTIVFRFWIISILLGLFSLMTLKIR